MLITVSPNQQIVSLVCSHDDWEVNGLQSGAMLPDTLQSLCSVASETTEPMVFHYVAFDGIWVDVHVLVSKDGFDLILQDVTQAHQNEQILQQKALEISLLSQKQAEMNAELEQLNEELVQRRREAELASQAKSRFIASMSHEFRSPITAVMGYADLLQKEFPDSGKPPAIQRASWHLLTLVENLLEQARLDEPAGTLNPGRFLLQDVIRDIEELFRLRADSKGLNLEFRVPDKELHVELDELRLRQVLINLLGNALGYTQAGSVTVECEHADNWLEISVHDTGVGIADADLEQIFKPFMRVGRQASAGAGLGLTITQQLVKRMGGALSVTSTQGQGSEFQFKIPCPEVSLNDLAETNVTERSDIRILLVDDDHDVLSLYSLLMSEWGWDYRTATGVEQAEQVFAQHPCQIVLTDLHLVDGNGLELLEVLHQREPQLVSILTSGSGEQVVQGSSQPGIYAEFLQKPVSADDLHRTIRNVTEKLKDHGAN
jgi:signal transduction histidine kinase/ActR/RegA family two-component response regulator